MKRFTFISTLLASLPTLLLGRRQPDDTFCPSGHQGRLIGMLGANSDPQSDGDLDQLFPNWTLKKCDVCKIFYTVYTPTLQRRNQPNAPLN